MLRTAAPQGTAAPKGAARTAITRWTRLPNIIDESKLPFLRKSKLGGEDLSQTLSPRRYTGIQQVWATGYGLESTPMSVKVLLWILLATIAVGAVLLLNHWAAYQFLSTLAYSGMVAALLGAANLAFPFRFLGVRKRAIGALVLVAGVIVSLTALNGPASTIRVAEPRTCLDAVIPEYQFSERHSARIHARPDQVLEAVRQSTFGDMRSLNTLLKIRGAVVRAPSDSGGAFARDKRILDAFSASGYVSGASEDEIVMAGGADLRAKRPLQARTLQELADYREPDTIKIGYDFNVVDTGDGWSTLTAETRVAALGDSGRGMARYWRLIVPGSGLLRLQWLDGIKRRAEKELQATQATA